VGKLAALGTSKAYIQSMGLLLPDLALFGAIAIELLGGLALALGLRTRLAALVLAGFSILTAMIFHAQFADQNQMIHFLKNVAIAGCLLQVAAFGATAFSLDGMFARSRFNRSPIAQSLGRCAGLPTTAARAVGSTDGRGCKAPAPSKR
jgi:putative oxidoreductase